jgi:hypothetical protein
MRSPGLISRPTALLVADLPAHDVSRGAKSTLKVNRRVFPVEPAERGERGLHDGGPARPVAM